jgi:hypothetical protein
MKTCTLVVALTFISLADAGPPALMETDRVRLAEAFYLADALGNKLWPEWDQAPFAVLLVTPEHEFLMRHPMPSDDFTLIGDDALLKSKVWYRKRKFSPQLLATFPAVGSVPTIVIGRAEGTAAKTSTPWVITLLHEHFHQLQNSKPRYFADVDALGLARGDQSGMWMLNYPFPYAEVKDDFAALSKSLAAALRARGQADFAEKFASYAEARRKFRSALKEDDRKYLDFQVWQEGIARYTEYHVATLAAGYQPSEAFRGLKDFTPYKDEATAILKRVEQELDTVRFDRSKRDALYAFGAAEGLVLDCARPDWRKRYFEDRFSLSAHFKDGTRP